MFDFLFGKKEENISNALNEIYSKLITKYSVENIKKDRKKYLKDIVAQNGYLPYPYFKALEELTPAETLFALQEKWIQNGVYQGGEFVFANNKINLLVSTTVIEVGIDVPNATVMLVHNSECFGLSQLHQLRGRTGRSSLQSYCVLVSSSNNEETLERLKIMTQTNDGFIIAEKDLELRGPGDFLGTKQSGLPDLLITDLTRDLAILELARKAAIKYFHNLDKDEIEKLLNTINEQTTNIVCMD